MPELRMVRRSTIIPFVLGIGSLAFLIFANVARGQEEETPAAGYVGSEMCMSCHEELAKEFEKNVHNKKGFHMRSDRGCETCHGPGQAHAESGDPSLIRRLGQMKPAEVSETCLTCHETGRRMHWKGGVHDQRALGCTSCHSVHNSKSENSLLRSATIDQQCGTCHLPIKSMLQRTSHHPIREGLMTCSDCHNPHGTTTPKMLVANSANEQCYTCHTEKRGPFLWEHPPVRENCLNCHNPHGSNHPKLLVSKRPYLCQQCHLDTRHPGTLYDAGNLNTSNREFARSCSNCHLQIHGSNHPSGWTFLR